jgi:dihydropteroate synthase
MDCFFYPTGNWINRRVLEIYVGSNDAGFPEASRTETIDEGKYRHASIDLDDEKNLDLVLSELDRDGFLSIMIASLIRVSRKKTSESKIMAAVNCTPDSFYTGSRLNDRIEAGLQKIIEEKPDFIDLGGESTRPGSTGIGWEEEVERIRPALQYLSENTDIPVSIDTRHHETITSLLQYGISMVNDITGLRSPEMRKVVRDNDLDAVIMHMRGEPNNMQTMTFYENITAELNRFFFDRMRTCWEEGIDLERIILDPGIGFAKGLKGNMEILRNIERFRIGQRLLVGTSRKTFIGKITGSPVEERLPGTIATSIYLSRKGVDILRLHDVRANRDAIRMMRLLEGSDGLA